MNSLQRRLLQSHKLNGLRTALHRWLNPCNDPRLVFIFGCQRSGTTLLRNLIGLDPRVQDYGEGDPPYFWQTDPEDPRYIRLIDLQDIEALRRRERSSIVLLKPLHDSQRARELLNCWPSSRAVFIHRDFREVILSHLSYYRDRYDLTAYVDDLLQLRAPSWKAENLGDEMRIFLESHRHLARNACSGLALFWLARNSLRSSQSHERLIGLNYRDLVARPARCLEVLGSHLNMEFHPRLASLPQERPRPAPLPEPIAPPLLEACEAMADQLQKQSALP